MDETDIRALVAESVSKVRKEMEVLKHEVTELKGETVKLKKENVELRSLVRNLEATVDETEQYSRKSCLILSGDGVPEPTKDETTDETRSMALKVIKEKLKVVVKGGVVACHRLRNKKRVLVKFQDMDDRNNVYQAKFNQTEGAGIVIHENLTEKRARQVKVLADMKRENDHVVNYHTKNGIILARDSREKRYARIQPWFTREEIIKAMDDSPALSHTGGKHPTQERFLQSQSLERIPAGHVLNKAETLENLGGGTDKRKTRQQKK